MLDDSHIHYVFRVHPKPNGVQRQLLGKILLNDGQMHILEDHGLPKDLQKLSPRDAAAHIWSLANSQRHEVICRADLLQGHHPDLLPTLDKPETLPEDVRRMVVAEQEGPKVSKFTYHRAGMPAPQSFELHGNDGFLDGHKLHPDELQLVRQNVKSGKAQLRPHVEPSQSLQKIEPALQNALGAVREAVQAGHIHPEHLQKLNRQIFTDSMVPSVGNKLAYNDFLTRPRKGTHVRLDATGFGQINKEFGHETGNKAIVAYFKAIRSSLDESVGRKSAKLFRIGGDEAHVWVPSEQHAAAFSRALRAKLETIPPLNGVYKFATGIGWGPTPEHAEAALIGSKQKIKMQAMPWGQARTEAMGHKELQPVASSPMQAGPDTGESGASAGVPVFPKQKK